MRSETPGNVGAGPIVVAVRGPAGPDAESPGEGDGGTGLLDSALSAAGLAELVESVGQPASPSDGASAGHGASTNSTTRTATVLVGIGAVTFTAPALISALVTRLEEAGLAVRVVGAVPSRDRDLGWTPESLAARHQCSPIGVGDPLADVRVSGFAEQSLHHLRPVARAWLEADLRVVLAPCATDAGQGFVGVLAALGAVAPTVPGANPAEAVADLLAQAPPDLAVLDATVVSHGAVGTAVRRELRAGVVVASRSALLVDVTAAALFGLDPGISTTVAACLSEVGLPPRHRVDGDLRPVPGVVVPSVPLVRSLPTTGGAAGLARILAAAAAVDAGTALGPTARNRASARAGEGDPGDAARPGSPLLVIAAEPDPGDPVLDGLRSALGPWVIAASTSPAAESALAGIQGTAALAANAVTAWRTTFAKDTLARVEAPLGLDLAAFRAADYEAVEELLRPLVDQVAALPDTGEPLKWQHLDGSVLFEARRTVNADFGSWIERVDISQAIRLMADYLGGRCVVVARDRSDRPIRQAERNFYLPQPNYVAFGGGRVIDVCKLEVIRYRRDSREIWWRTVRSPNGSADYDDGTVEFADVGDGRTRITIRGRQRFSLPLFWQVLDIDRTPGLREVLTADAYRRFFTATLDNFEACYEGRPFQIGRKPLDRGLQTKELGVLLGTAVGAGKEWLARASVARRPSTRPPDEVDADGFRHFRADGRD